MFAHCYLGRPTQRAGLGTASAWILVKPTALVYPTDFHTNLCIYHADYIHLLLPYLTIDIMSEYTAGVASPAYRALDDVPTRPAMDGSFVGAGLPAKGADSGQPQASRKLDRSCSPTPSEIDALDEAFGELNIEPGQTGIDSAQSSASDTRTGTTMTLISLGTCSMVPQHPGLLLPTSDLTLDLEADRGTSLGDRLRLVWRRSIVLISARVLC